MAKTQIGLVYYSDDPDRKIFRQVFPTLDDSELDDPQWTTLGLDQTRTAAMLKILNVTDVASAAYNLSGTPSAPATTNGLDIHGNPWPPIPVVTTPSVGPL